MSTTMSTKAAYPNSQDNINEFLNKFHRLIMDRVVLPSTDPTKKMIKFAQPNEIERDLELDIKNEENGVSEEKLLELANTIIDYSVLTGHPRFFNQLYGGLNTYGLAGAFLTSALNTHIHTFAVAPAFVVLERHLLEKFARMIGYEEFDGTFVPGGVMSNLQAIQLARQKLFPEVKTKGLYQQSPLVCYSSEEAHYSLIKGCNFQGFGTENAVSVRTGNDGKMDPEALNACIEATIKEGKTPFFVIATSGTTVRGAFDPLREIAAICKQYNMWLHVDACWGGPAILLETTRHLMDGVELSDSFSWNLHKLVGVPTQCSVIITKHKNLLMEANSLQAEYIYQPDKNYDVEYDPGVKTILCGRHADSAKLYLMWKAHGDRGIRQIVERALQNARYLAAQVRKTEGFELIMDNIEWTNVCFWYVPRSMRSTERNKEWWEKLGKVAPVIRRRMTEAGKLLIGYQPLSCKGLPNFFRMVLHNPSTEISDMDFVITEIDKHGHDL